MSALTTCPFCGAQARTDWGFQCGSGPAVAKPERSMRCREAEVARLTKEREEWKAVADMTVHKLSDMAFRCGQAEGQLAVALARIKRLEEDQP